MKLKALSLAIAACSLMSGAYAVAPDAANFKDFPIITAGASAQDKAVISHVVSDLCDSGTIDIYANSALTALAPIGTNDTNVSCNVPNASLDLDNNAATASSQLLFRKLSGGGSINGINAVGNATAPTVQYRALTTANCGTTPTGTIANYLKTGKTVNVWFCNTANEADANLTQPKIGFADVDPITLVGSSPANLLNKTSFVLTFGVQVTKALRDVLQAAQFGTTGASALRIGSENLADMPTLSIADLASLYRAGGTSDWNTFTTTSNNAPSFGTLSAVAAQAGLPAPANTKVQVVRRVAGSGTQAVLQSLILGSPCNGDYKLNPATDNTPLSTTSGTSTNWLFLPSGAAVHEESSAGNVVLALEALFNAKEWAIGFNSLEIGSANTRYVKVNGAEPTVQQVAGNAYPLWAENIITINSTANVNTAPNYKGFYDGFKAGVALSELNAEFDPRIAEVTAAVANNCGVGEQCVGYLNPALATDTSTFTNANPTATATRGLGSAAPNMCRPATVIRTAVVEDGSFVTPTP